MNEPISYPVSQPISDGIQPTRGLTSQNGHARGATHLRSNTRYSSLSPTQQAVLQAITKHGQLTASQVRRLCYTGTPEGVRIRCQRHLTRLTSLGLVRRFWGVYYGAAQYIYMPAGTTTRGPVFHTLDISELYVRLATQKGPELVQDMQSLHNFVFDREPWCHIKIGHVEVKPDAFLKFNETEQYFIEVDRSSADRSKLARKLRQYVNLYEQWDVEVDGETFPQVIYTVLDSDRKRIIEGVAKTQRYNLFRVMLFDEAVDKLAN